MLASCDIPEDLLLALAEQNQRLLAEECLHEFVKQAWPHIEGGKDFVDGWHIKAICEHLEALVRGDLRNLLINVPPRCSKSTIVAVMFPAWVWIKAPHKQFLFASYAASLSIRDSVKCRRLITSPWYQARWGSTYKLASDQNAKVKFENNAGGYRLATSVGGTATGEGGDFLLVDDPNNARDGESEVKRESTNAWWDQVWSTRLNDPKTGSRCAIQQRLHEMDISGHIIANDTENAWTKLILPMEFEAARRSKTIVLPSTNGKSWQDPRTKPNELLWPERVGEKELKQLKVDLGNPYTISGQLQQRPSPEGGGIIKAPWFSWWKHSKPPKVLRVIGSLDTAFETKDSSNYSALTTWGYFNEDTGTPALILLSLWRGKVEYPDLRELCLKVYDDYRNDGSINIVPDGRHTMDMLLVEAKANGISLVQDLRRGNINAHKFDPTKEGDKNQRVSIASSYIKDGLIWLPALGPTFKSLRPMSETLVEQCKLFPAGESRDIVDTLSQVILYMKNNGALNHRKDPNFMTNIKRTMPGKYNDYKVESI